MKMKAHTFGWLIFLALIKSFSCNPNNPFELEGSNLTAAEGSCIEIKCNIIKKVNPFKAYWFWMKDAVWIEKTGFKATTIFNSSESEHHANPHFAKRVTYTGSPSEHWNKDPSPKTTCNILIRDLNKTDTGNYSFRFVGNTEDNKWATQPFMNLTVTENPCLLTFEKPKNVIENNNVTLRCSTLSSCPSDLKIEDALGLISRSSKSQNPKEATLTFKATSEDDGRIFSCQTENNSDACLIRNISLTVGYAPKSLSAKTSSTIVKEGQSVTLTCSANGQPNPSITWMKNNQSQSTEASWTIPSVTETHTGSYHCRAQNIHGFKNSEEVTINVTYVPDVRIEISQEPERRAENFIQGDRVSFKCSAKRSNPPTHSFTWLKGNETLHHNQTYVVERIEPEHSGNYTCKAENTVGSGSKTLQLRVRYKPRNTRISLNNATVKIGTLLKLTCETDAYPHAFTYSWYRYDRSDSSQKIFLGSQNPLILMKVQRADEGRYICNASNIVDRGDTSNEVHIEVLFPPNNTELYMTEEVTEGQNVTVRCTAESFPLSSFSLARPSASNSQTPERGLTLSTDPYEFVANSADAGFYTCEATNSEGRQRSPEKKLVVKYIPKEVKVEAHPGLVIKENESLTLDCSAKSYPPVSSVTWTKVTDEMNKSSAQRNFIVKSVSVSDSGWYSCTATNEIGSGKSEQVEVKVKHGPKYTEIVKGEEVENEDGTYSVTLTCISQCYPSVSQYSWYRRTGEKEDQKLESHPTLIVNSQESGEYYCVAVNEIGERASETIKLFDDTVTTILKFFLLCLVLLILCALFFLYRRKRNRSIHRGTTNAWACSGCLGWRNGVRRRSGNRVVVEEPFRSRDDLLPDQPCRPNARRHERHPDSTTASNINTVYATVNLPKGKQGASAQNPTERHGGHMESDSLNYASLHFINKKKDPAEDAEYSVVSKPKKSKEKEQDRLEDYENFSTVDAAKPPYKYDFDTDSDTSEDDIEVNYTQVNFKPKSGHQKARKDSSSSSSSSSSAEDETQYSEVKI